jgi:hypothetical protein
MIRNFVKLRLEKLSNFNFRSFSDYIKGTRCYRLKEKGESQNSKQPEEIYKKSEPSYSSSSNISDTDEHPHNENSSLLEEIETIEEEIEEKEKNFNKNTPNLGNSELNMIDKESHNKDSGRSFKVGLNKKDSKTKEFPHGYDKI